MFRKMIKNEFQKNPVNNLVLFLLMTMSITVVVSVLFMLFQLYTSINSMYEISRPPHFLQMHKGEINQEQLDQFNQEFPGIEHWQTVEMIDLYGEQLTVNGKQNFNLSDCRLDISLVKQNQDYDVLLNEKREPVQLQPGEIGVPVILLNQYPFQIGDCLTIKDGKTKRDFVIKEYVYDGQMNSTLCSSTRFLLNNQDFDALFGKTGETEYLIEAYMKDKSMITAYQTAYEKSEWNLPKDGQAVTYTMIFLLSALTDIITAFLLLVGGVLLISVALLALRYTILVSLEEDIKEIGTMRAIGIPQKGIQMIYLNKIRILMAIGSVAGYFSALGVRFLLTERMKRTFGEVPMERKVYLFGVILTLFMAGSVILFTKIILGKIKKVTVIDALVLEKGIGKEHFSKDGIHKALRMPINLCISLKEVKRGYGIVTALLALVTILIMIPVQLVNTMNNEEFIRYMGSNTFDMMIEVEQGEKLEDRKQKVDEVLKGAQKDGDKISVKQTKEVRLQVIDKEGKLQGIHIDTGMAEGEGLKYLYGQAPKTEKEIALSSVMANELGKRIGESIVIVEEDGSKTEFIISGIYQDVTSGGKTAKTAHEFKNTVVEKYSYQIELVDKSKAEVLATKWREQLGAGYDIENMREYSGQTFGGIATQVEKIEKVLFVIGITLITIILVLFLKLRMVRTMKEFATKRAMGISLYSIYLQELYPVLIAGGIGIIIGCFIIRFFGDKVISLLFSCLGLGMERISFVPLPIWKGLGIPFVLLFLISGLTLVLCLQIKKIRITEYIS